MQESIDQIALDYNNQSTHIDISQQSEITLPSLSFDENGHQGNDFFLKELHDKIERLREENFDLKMKLYLLESKENLSSDSELKMKVSKEFDRKNAEIRNLKQIIADQHNAGDKLASKHRLHSKDNEKLKQDNQKLKSKLIELFHVYTDLYNHANELKDLVVKTYENNENNPEFIDKLNSSQKILERTSQFFSENNFDTINHLDQVDHYIARKSLKNQSTQTERQNSTNPVVVRGSKIHSTSLQTLKHCVDDLQTNINKFRNNQINYKTFLEKLDEIFDKIQTNDLFVQNMDLEQQQQQQHDKTTDDEYLFKQKIHSSLLEHLQQLERLNLKIIVQNINKNQNDLI